MADWPVFADTATAFFDGPLARPRRLLSEFTARGTGSGRRAGPRELLWQTVAISSVAALEAGLEDLLLAAHAVRLGAEGATVRSGTNAPEAKVRKWLADDRLMGPSAQKVERILFGDFAVLLAALPAEGQFRPRRKTKPNAGSGQGQEVVGPAAWRDLREYFDAVVYIRNAAAHGDASKLGAPPSYLKCEGDLWLKKADGNWSVQQPHALTAVRTVLAVHNTIAAALAAALGVPKPTLTSPSVIVFP
jgi:hypothetical protein